MYVGTYIMKRYKLYLLISVALITVNYLLQCRFLIFKHSSDKDTAVRLGNGKHNAQLWN